MFRVFKQILLLVLCLSFLQACNKVDDYFLGKDNAPTPEALPEAVHKVKMIPAWTVNVGSGAAGLHENLTPVIKDNRLYLALPGGKIQERDIQTGQLYWQQTVAFTITSGPTVSEGVIAFCTNRFSLVVLNQRDGQILWEKRLSSQILAKPLIASGKVIVKSVDGHVQAFDIKTGKKVWHWQHGSPDLILKASSSPILIPPNEVLVGYADGKLDALDLQTGHLLWQKGLMYATGASDVERLVDIDADPLYYLNMLILGSYQGFVGGFSLENKDWAWRKPASIYHNMVLKNGRLYVTDESDIIWAINPINGQTYWQQVHLKARSVTAPVWTSMGILVGDKQGLLHLLSIQEGALVGRSSVSGVLTTPPVVSGHRVLVLTENGHLHAIDLKR